GQQFPIAADLFAHPMPIYWCDRLFAKMHIRPPTERRPDSRHLEYGIGPTEARLSSSCLFHSREFGVDLLVSIRGSEQLRNLESSAMIFQRRQTLANHGCRSRGKPAGR